MLLRIIILSIALFIQPNLTLAQDGSRESMVAGFVYGLIDYIDWQNKTNIEFCISGHDEISIHFPNFYDKRMLKIDKVNIEENMELSDVTDCDMIYIAKNMQKHIPLILEKKKASAVTISPIENFKIMGGTFEVSVVRNRVRLGVDHVELAKSGNKLSPLIMNASVGNGNYLR